jgi:hypothetical protein
MVIFTWPAASKVVLGRGGMAGIVPRGKGWITRTRAPDTPGATTGVTTLSTVGGGAGGAGGGVGHPESAEARPMISSPATPYRVARVIARSIGIRRREGDLMGNA